MVRENIFRYWVLVKALAAKEIKIKYKSAVLGWVWSILHPLLLMIMFSLIFTYIIPVNRDHFPLFLLCALLPWFFFSFSLSSATTSVVDNSSLIKKAYFSYEVIPVSVVVANLVNFLISLGLLIVFLCLGDVFPSWYILFLPVLVFLQVIFVTGVCFICSALHTMYRDIKYGIELILIIWFYATPIFYDLSFVPERFRGIFYFNPLSIFVSLYREILLYRRMPSMALLGMISVISITTLILGKYVFNRYKRYFADVT